MGSAGERLQSTVRLVVSEGNSAAQAARDLGISEQTLVHWRKAAKAGKRGTGSGTPITPEQMDLSRLRAENARLKMEAEILEKATAYFAKVSR